MRLHSNTYKDWKGSTDVSKSAESQAELETPSAENRPASGKRLRNGNLLVESDTYCPTRGGPRLKADPKTGIVTADDDSDARRKMPVPGKQGVDKHSDEATSPIDSKPGKPIRSTTPRSSGLSGKIRVG